MMTIDEKRKSPRIDSHNLLSYICFDENDRELRQGMGRTLNVSEGGILMETHVHLEPDYKVSLTMSLEDELMDIEGRVVFCSEREDGKFENRIQFMEMDEAKLKSLKQFLVIFRGQKDDS